jgi:hypothetical protein
MFSSVFYQNKFQNSEKMKKIVKESMDKYIRSLEEKYKRSQTLPLIKNGILNINDNNDNNNIENKKNYESATANMIGILPFLIFGWGVYQLSKSLFSKH